MPTLPSRCSGALRVSTWPGFAPTSTASHHRNWDLVPELPRAQRGVIDTSVVIDLESLEASQLPIELAVSAITMAELAASPSKGRGSNAASLRWGGGSRLRTDLR